MASKFWGKGSDSEEESSEEEETTSSEEESSSEGESSDSSSSSGSSDDSSKPKKGGASRFLMGSSDSESEDERRVVKSAKTKAVEELQNTCNDIRNKMNINDWSVIQTLFDKLNKQLEKTMKATGALGVPRVYIRLLVELEDFLAKTLAEKPKLSPTNTRALSRMKQQLRRHNAGYAEQIAAFRENPVSDSEPESEAPPNDDGKFRLARTGVVARPKDRVLTMDPKEITYEVVSKKLREIALARGKSTRLDRQEQVEMLAHLAGLARGPAQRLQVLVASLTVVFDMNRPTQAAMTPGNWARCAATLFDILALLEAHPELELRLDDEWNGSLKGLDPHAHEYMDRLRDETVLLALAAAVAQRCEATGAFGALATVSLRRIDHLYHKTAPEEEGGAAEGFEPRDGSAAGPPPPVVRLPPGFALPADAAASLEALVRTVYAHGTDNQKGQALLASVYWRAVHDDYHGARDLLLSSRIQDQTGALENRLQVLHNRAIAQLGLAAFRAGLVPDAHACLADLYGTGRVKELLAQGIQAHRYAERSPEQEAIERRRQVPFHLHINLELLESVYLTSALLLEVPHAAASGNATLAGGERRRPLSKPLRRLLDNYERQTFVGPPENVRDHIIAAVRALSTGDWRKAYGYVSSLACWALMPQREAVLDALRDRFKVEGLRTYLLTYARYYSSLSVAALCEMFDLPERRVHAVVSRLLADEALAGAHDQPTGTVVVRAAEPSRLAALAAGFADRAALLVDLNERALALRTGGSPGLCLRERAPRHAVRGRRSAPPSPLSPCSIPLSCCDTAP
ncbi:Eukaryotic translation initiation factor 3 subunit C [Auxenochlorella protothecoides]|uniref:Eukaryotic translation initiation factor 3 subunit C n=1 Tax=Auxenochlorella protothecoides TaxID=3075 RepID=A0A087SGE1_AUXPR|nr:Eukaryotic translation initiation factor 3 subunit C [Auxenochlorella protothecoides]KFM24795.1 Eukaryotic translation initiation factor 3 subunit C [Auxenochlorella protothecoides]